MVKQNTILLFLVLLSGVFTNAQTLERYVIGSLGTTFSAADTVLSIGVGELAVLNITDGTTTIQQGFYATPEAQNTLSRPDFDIETVTIYPNPAKDVLNVTFSSAITLQKIEFYDTKGSLVQTISNPSFQIDVNQLKPAIYVLKIYANNRVNHLKFIKE